MLRVERMGLTPSTKKKSARELRQGGSDYRCCIAALAGFVSPQSIAPDGKKLFSKDGLGAISFSRGGDLSPAERSGKRQVRLNSIYIGLINCGRFGHARRFGSSVAEEVCLYIAHGLLHLHGFDDKNPIAAAKMERAQKNLVRAVGWGVDARPPG